MSNLPHLKKLSLFRGNEKALKIIGDRRKVSLILDNFSNYSRNDLTEAILSCYDGETYGSNMWTRRHEAWGNRSEIITPYGIFSEKNPNLSQLNLDMGFLSYLPQFLEYAEKTDLEEDHYSVRENFKKRLGTTTLWRGIRLTKKELNHIENYGINSSFFRIKYNQFYRLEQFEANILTTYPWALLENQFYGGHQLSPLISITADKSLAEKVGKSHSKICMHTGEPKRLYLFEIKINFIDVIPYTDHCLKAPDKLQHMIEREKEKLKANNQQVNHYLWKTNLEQFVLYKIDANEIVNIIKP